MITLTRCRKATLVFILGALALGIAVYLLLDIPGHAAFQPGNFTTTGTLHPGVTIPPAQNMTLF